MSIRIQSGSISFEYLWILSFIGVISYALMGGIDAGVDGGMDGDPETEDPTVVSLINDKQHEFARDIYQP
ncbi:MAG: hypothetical protein VYA55_13485 [Pseudomonadota bacterium]|nr:hypothetical protein [Pseudomonadota bacterium]